MEVSWPCLQRAGVTGPLWFYGRNMRVLGAEMDQEAGTALIKCVLLCLLGAPWPEGHLSPS